MSHEPSTAPAAAPAPQGSAAPPASAASAAPAVHLPEPSPWPFWTAAAVTCIALGIVTNLIFTGLGLALLALSIGGWIGDVRRAAH